MWSRWFHDRWRGVRRTPHPRLGLALAVALGVLSLAFWVARNLPGLEWLAP